MAVDPYVYPGTNTLRNRFGIEDPDELATVEDRLSTLRLIVVDALGVPGTFDIRHLQTFHRMIFGDLYEWAGELRTVDIAKGHLFALHQYVEAYLTDCLVGVRAENYLRGLPREQVVDRFAYYLAEINAAHPFREGNGRTQRAYIRQLAHRAGWDLDWHDLDPSENIDASIASLNGNNEPLRQLLDGRLLPLQAGNRRSAD